MLDRIFPEEKVGEVANIIGGDEVRLCRRRGRGEEESEWEKKDTGRKNEESQEKVKVQRGEGEEERTLFEAVGVRVSGRAAGYVL